MLSIFSIFRRSPSSSTEAKSKRRSSEENRKFFGSPLFNVLLMMTLMLGVSGVFRFLEWRKINAQTQIQFNDSDNIEADEKAKNKTVRQPANIFGGEVVQTSRRLRETGALGFAVCLSILDEARAKRQIPGSINGLINAVTKRDLLPPDLTIENGEIRSPTSVIYIRYQPEPMQLEFVSIPFQANGNRRRQSGFRPDACRGAGKFETGCDTGQRGRHALNVSIISAE